MSAVRAAREVTIDAYRVALPGTLHVPAGARGIVLFAHGSGSSRFSTRNRWVAGELEQRGLATLLLDLLTPVEAHDRARVFDIALLGSRVAAAIEWVGAEPELDGLALGLFGASTGAAAALSAAARLGARVDAVVSRGGRPDLASAVLPQVSAPTLLIVGSLDREVLELNRRALALLGGERELRVVEGASHLFEEPGTLERVAQLAAEWFVVHASPPAA